MILTSLDEIYSWGSGTYGECGYGEVNKYLNYYLYLLVY